MNVITREYIYDLLENKLKITDDEEIYLVMLIEELYNTKNSIVAPLDEEETFVFRKRFGILDNGIPQSKEVICKEYNIGYKKYPSIMEKILYKFMFRIKNYSKRIKKEKINSLNTLDKDILEKPISSFPLGNNINSKLMKSYIFTLKDLMEYSEKELKSILSPVEIDLLISYIHSLNIKFLNELDESEKKAIVENYDLEVIGNSSPYFIDKVDKYSYDSLTRNGINDVKSLIENVFIFPTRDRIEIMTFISKNNLASLARKEESKKI